MHTTHGLYETKDNYKIISQTMTLTVNMEMLTVMFNIISAIRDESTERRKIGKLAFNFPLFETLSFLDYNIMTTTRKATRMEERR